MRSLLGILLFTFSNSQSLFAQGPSGEFVQKNPQVFVVCSSEIHKAILKETGTSGPAVNRYEFRYFTTENQSPEKLEFHFNQILNEESGLDFNRLYFLVIGDSAEQELFAGVDKSVFAFAESFTRYHSGLLSRFLENCERKYLWHADLNRIRTEREVVNYSKGRWSLGLTTGINSQNAYATDSVYLPGRFLKYGLSLQYQRGKRWQIAGTFLFSIKRPDQNAMQSSIQSQLDFNAGGIQKVKMKMQMHLFFQTNLQVNYLFRPDQNLRPFVGLGISQLSFTSMNQTLENEIDLSALSSGGGGPPSGGFPSGFSAANLSGRPFSTRNLLLTTGFQYQLSKVFRASFSYEFDVAQSQTFRNTTVRGGIQNHALRFGLQAIFQRRKNSLIEYFR